MSEPVDDFLVDAIARIIEASMDGAIGDYFTHEQADKIRQSVASREKVHFKHDNCPICESRRST